MAAAGDGFTTDDDSAPLESLPILPRRLCELLDACGGDLTGEWTTEDVCIAYMTNNGKAPLPDCEGSTIEGVIDEVEGSYSFNEDGSYTAHMKYAGQTIVTAPQRCLRPGLSCSELLPEEEQSDARCVTRGGRCECSRDWALESVGEVQGTYSTSDSRLELSNDGPMEYCVKNERLKLRTIAEIPRVGEGLSVELQLELTRKP